MIPLPGIFLVTTTLIILCYHKFTKTLLKIPKIQIAALLSLIFLSALLKNLNFQNILVLLLALSSTLISDFIFTKIRHTPHFLLSAALVSGLIIALLTDPNLPVYIPIVAGILAMFSKNFLRFQGKHIFNPAGFGLLATAFIFQTEVSWWGATLAYFLILLLPGYVSIKRMRRYFTIFSFMATYGVISLLLKQDFSYQAIVNAFFDPTPLFFALVMLPEPITTPYIPKYQIMFGVFIAAIALLISTTAVPDPLIAALLLGNLLFFKTNSL